MIGNVIFDSGRNLCSRGRNGDIQTTGVTVESMLHSRHGSGAVRLMPITSKGHTSGACAIELPSTRKAVDEISAMLLQIVAYNECLTLAKVLADVSDARKQARLPALTLPTCVAEIIGSDPRPFRWGDAANALLTMTDEARAELATVCENGWREVAAQTDGVDKTLLCRLKGAIDTLRHAGYSVGDV